MKTAFGILALYISIPLAIVATQLAVGSQAAQPQPEVGTAIHQSAKLDTPVVRK